MYPQFVLVFPHTAGVRPPPEVTRDFGFYVTFFERLARSVYVANPSTTCGPRGHKLLRCSSRVRQVAPGQCLAEKCVYMAFLLGSHMFCKYHVVDTYIFPRWRHVLDMIIGSCLPGRRGYGAVQGDARRLLREECEFDGMK